MQCNFIHRYGKNFGPARAGEVGTKVDKVAEAHPIHRIYEETDSQQSESEERKIKLQQQLSQRDNKAHHIIIVILCIIIMHNIMYKLGILFIRLWLWLLTGIK